VLLVALAGSDWPPPRGFAAVVAIGCLLGVVTVLLVPRMLDLADRAGPNRALLAALTVGAALGVAIGVAFAARGSGEPSAPAPGTAEVGTFVVVVTLATALGAGLVAVGAMVLDRFSRRGPSPDGG
jgi:nitrate/nitrite transporter NarK